MKKKTIKSRNPVAKNMNKVTRPAVHKAKTAYDRKREKQVKENDD